MLGKKSEYKDRRTDKQIVYDAQQTVKEEIRRMEEISEQYKLPKDTSLANNFRF